eukprot:scaffold104046_cov63-Phaeocystis_antarctica.AAC.3
MRAGDAVQGGGARWGERAAAHVAVVSRRQTSSARGSAFQSACDSSDWSWFFPRLPRVRPRYRKYTLPCSTATIKPPRVNATSGGATEFSPIHPGAHRPPPSILETTASG